jgi:hypothetical protein
MDENDCWDHKRDKHAHNSLHVSWVSWFVVILSESFILKDNYYSKYFKNADCNVKYDEDGGEGVEKLDFFGDEIDPFFCNGDSILIVGIIEVEE